MSNDLIYAVCDYFATGEGRCISMLIIRPDFDDEDYESKPNWTVDIEGAWTYYEGVLKEGVTVEDVVKREFTKEFDSWYAIGMELLERDVFFERFDSCIPTVIKNLTDPAKGPIPAFHWKQQIYYNFS
jgi:hypothetical protein